MKAENKIAAAIVIVIILSGVLVFLSGVGYTTRIGQITENPNDYYGKEVYIKGVVTYSGAGAFEVQDNTGSILCMGELGPQYHQTPPKGQRVIVKGTIFEDYFGDTALRVDQTIYTIF